jgi:deoxyribonuclease-4
MTLGRKAEEIGAILSAVPKRLRHRTGYGLDTCHLLASGHDITRSEAELRRVLDEFEKAAESPPAFFHLNDSEGALGSNKDRHVLIGDGKIGREPFAWLLRDPRAAGIPLILETPQQNYDIPEDDASPDPYDVAMMKLLDSMTPA